MHPYEPDTCYTGVCTFNRMTTEGKIMVEFMDVEIPAHVIPPVAENPFTGKVTELVASKRAAQFVISKAEGATGTLEAELERQQKLVRAAARAAEMTAKFDIIGNPTTADSLTVTFWLGPKISRPRKNGKAAEAVTPEAVTPETSEAESTPEAAPDEAPAVEPTPEATPDEAPAVEPTPEATPDEAPESEATPEADAPETSDDAEPQVPARRGGRFARSAR